MSSYQVHDNSPLIGLLEPGEQVRAYAEATDASLVVTDRRVAVAVNDRLAMAVPFEDLRRVQFDIERDRPATLVLVPDRPADRPQVLAIPPEQYSVAAAALALIGQRLANSPTRG